MLMGTGVEGEDRCFQRGKYVVGRQLRNARLQVTTYRVPDIHARVGAQAGLGVGLNGRPWGVSWSGTEGTILLNDARVGTGHRKTQGQSRTRETSEQRRRPARPRPQLPRLCQITETTGCSISTRPSCFHRGPPRQLAFRSGRKITWDAANETGHWRSQGR